MAGDSAAFEGIRTALSPARVSRADGLSAADQPGPDKLSDDNRLH